jgi:hypothetical protein
VADVEKPAEIAMVDVEAKPPVADFIVVFSPFQLPLGVGERGVLRFAVALESAKFRLF